ncbi:hypothetical protein AAMO2058_000666800, partial [Amorphochlora amoebiformis]
MNPYLSKLSDKDFSDNNMSNQGFPKKHFMRELREVIAQDVFRHVGDENVHIDGFHSYMFNLLANNMDRKEADKIGELTLQDIVSFVTGGHDMKDVQAERRAIKRAFRLRQSGLLESPQKYFEHFSRDFKKQTTLVKVLRLMAYTDPKQWNNIGLALMDNTKRHLRKITKTLIYTSVRHLKKVTNILMYTSIRHLRKITKTLIYTSVRHLRKVTNILMYTSIRHLKKITKTLIYTSVRHLRKVTNTLIYTSIRHLRKITKTLIYTSVRHLRKVMGKIDVKKLESIPLSQLIPMKDFEMQFGNGVYVPFSLDSALASDMARRLDFYLDAQIIDKPSAATEITEPSPKEEEEKEEKKSISSSDIKAHKLKGKFDSNTTDLERVNEWCSVSTKGRIKKAFDTTVPGYTNTILPMSVAYIKGKLAAPLMRMTDGVFHVAEGLIVRCLMMQLRPVPVNYIKTR